MSEKLESGSLLGKMMKIVTTMCPTASELLKTCRSPHASERFSFSWTYELLNPYGLQRGRGHVRLREGRPITWNRLVKCLGVDDTQRVQIGRERLLPMGTLSMNRVDTAFKRRLLLFGGWVLVTVLVFLGPLTNLIRTSLLNGDSSYLIFIPLISAWVLFVDRGKIFVDLSYNAAFGGAFLSGAVCAAFFASLAAKGPAFDPRTSGYILALVVLWTAGFALFFGKAASRSATFPLLFLLLMVPLPQILLNRVVYLLQAGSAWIAGAFFDLVGVPALREGFVFHLPTVNIEVSQECSGIRSSMVLLILALVVAHFYLKAFWSKTLLVICGLFIMILKNGIRIATLTLLAIYVNPSFLDGRLHHQGGIVFFLVGLLLLLPVLWFLQRGESRHSVADQPATSEL